MPGHFRIEIPSASGKAHRDNAEADPYAFSLPGARLWCDQQPLALGRHGYLIGHLFERGGKSCRVMDLHKTAVARIGASSGRSLVSDYWGGYVAILVRPGGGLAIFRAPSGLRSADRRLGTGWASTCGDGWSQAH